MIFDELPLTIKQMGDDEIMSQLLQGGISNQPMLTKDVPNEGSVRDFEESSSSVIKSTLYDWNETRYWDNQMIDMNFVPDFQNASDFDFGLDG